MNNKDKFLSLVSEGDSSTLARNEWLIKNRSWLRKSQEIAMLILDSLEVKGWSQKKLALEMNVSPQLVNKWVKGNENFTLDSISKLEDVLDITILVISSETIYSGEELEKLGTSIRSNDELVPIPKRLRTNTHNKSIDVIPNSQIKERASIAVRDRKMNVPKIKA